MNKEKSVLVLGASVKEARYSNKAAKALLHHDYKITLMGLRSGEVSGNKIYTTIDEVVESGVEIDTITLYLGPKNQGELMDIVRLVKPRRVIFNPGTENELMYHELDKQGVIHEEACTLVLLSIGEF